MSSRMWVIMIHKSIIPAFQQISVSAWLSPCCVAFIRVLRRISPTKLPTKGPGLSIPNVRLHSEKRQWKSHLSITIYQWTPECTRMHKEFISYPRTSSAWHFPCPLGALFPGEMHCSRPRLCCFAKGVVLAYQMTCKGWTPKQTYAQEYGRMARSIANVPWKTIP